MGAHDTALPPELEAEVRAYLVQRLPIEQAPAHLRLAFHDAGTYDVQTHSGGAHGSIHLLEEMARDENAGWSRPCIDLLAEAKERFPALSWADLVALSGAAAVERCSGPSIAIGLGRTDAAEPSPEHRLPATEEGLDRLRRHFDAMGLTVRDQVALSGGHTLGGAQGRPFTDDRHTFDNTYFRQLLDGNERSSNMLDSDRALLEDPELRSFVELYAADQARFFADFGDAYRRLTWLGNERPGAHEE